jgi:prepilin-type processing-associated H-X9-DG protein
MTRREFAVVCIFVAVLLTCLMPALPIDFALYLIVGWIIFTARVVPQVRIGWGGVTTGIICLILFAAGLHAFLDWYSKETRVEGDQATRGWKWRWTASLVALIVLLFVAGLSTVGIAHQVGWLLTSKEALFAGSPSAAARRAQSLNNLKQIGLGLYNYHDGYGTYPPGGTFDVQGQPLHGWQSMLLPSVEQGALFNQINLSVPWDDPRNSTSFQTVVNAYLNPGIRPEGRTAGAGYAPSYYAGNARVLGAHALRDIKDGGSQTIMAGEAAGGFRPWGYPANWRDPAQGINRSPDGFGGPYKGGASVLFADGSVRFLKDSLDLRILKALSTPDGGEEIPTDRY